MKEKELGELMDKATKKVAEQFEGWVNEKVEVILSKAEEIEISDLNKILLSFINSIIVYSSLQNNNIKGVSLTILNKKDAKTLASLLTGNLSISKFFNEKEYSAIRETSNVVSGTYANILANRIGEVITSTQPLMVNSDDLEDLEKELIGIEYKHSKVILLKSIFKIRKQNLNILLLLFFNKGFSKKFGDKKK